ncbi:zinc-ribbon domain-containing protein, partial [Rhodobaculum claviforme]
MRIVCTNCAAQYEVDAAAIPATGRDLECSACGTVWFFTPPAPRADDPGTTPHDTSHDTPHDVPHGTQAPEPVRRPPPVDPSVLAVLRAEAERESRARRADAGLIDTTSDQDTRRRRLPPAPVSANDPPPPAEPRRRPGRDRLPAIDNIDP